MLGAHVTAGAGAVFNDGRLTEGLREMVAEQSRQDVCAAADREGHDDGDGLAGKVLHRFCALRPAGRHRHHRESHPA